MTAPAGVESSHAYIKAHDLRPKLISYLEDLDKEQAAIAARDKIVSKTNPAYFIAKVLSAHGCDYNTQVEKAIMIIEAARNAVGDQEDLAAVSRVLKPQWQTYRVFIQEGARSWIEGRVRLEGPSFVNKWFAAVKFSTLWNDLWKTTFPATLKGGAQLEALDTVATELFCLEKPSDVDAADRLKKQLTMQLQQKHPGRAFPFSREDMQQVIKYANEACVAQEQRQYKIVSDVQSQLNSLAKLARNCHD
jgi:hypothetical protein